MTDLSVHDEHLLAKIAEALEPFARAWRALPKEIAAEPGRNLADMIAIYRADDAPALTVGNLQDLMIGYLGLSLRGSTRVGAIKPAPLEVAAATDNVVLFRKPEPPR